MTVEQPRRGPYKTFSGTLATCPIHYWSGPNVALVDGAAPVCWDGGHILDEAALRRGFGR